VDVARAAGDGVEEGRVQVHRGTWIGSRGSAL
jgi:hypothetical protein